jgi:hypothetical protein
MDAAQARPVWRPPPTEMSDVTVIRTWTPAQLQQARDGEEQHGMWSGRQDPPLLDTDLPQAAGSNYLSNIPLEPGGTGYVEGLVRPAGRDRGQ